MDSKHVHDERRAARREARVRHHRPCGCLSSWPRRPTDPPARGRLQATVDAMRTGREGVGKRRSLASQRSTDSIGDDTLKLRAPHQPIGELHRQLAVCRVGQHPLDTRACEYPLNQLLGSLVLRRGRQHPLQITTGDELRHDSLDNLALDQRARDHLRHRAGKDSIDRLLRLGPEHATSRRRHPADAGSDKAADLRRSHDRAGRSKRTIRAGAAPIRPTLAGFPPSPSRSFSVIDSRSLSALITIRMVGRVRRWS